ncbi:MAG: DUF115 domain-containing protein, partial [Aquificaceae bacterium]|nr:DUF115 domain-containing protein [Aquificaceae bacterium]
DIHVELERTKITYDCISEVSRDFLKDVFLITTNPVWTECFDLFQQGGVVLKEHDSGASFFDKAIPRTINSGVTVGSLGVSVALLLGFREIYLVGLDLGSKIPELHHSTNTNYYNSDSFMSKLPHSRFDKVVKANFGGQAYTNSYFWLTAQSISQNSLIYKDASIFNLSDGIYISGTIPLMMDELNFNSKLDKKRLLDVIFSAFSRDYAFDVDVYFNKVRLCIQDIVDSITQAQVRDIKSLVDIATGVEKAILSYKDIAHLFTGDLRAAKTMLIGAVLEGGITPPEAWERFRFHTLRYLELCNAELTKLSYSIQHLKGATSTEQMTL